GDTLLSHHPFERREPMIVVGLAGVGIACGLRLLDLVRKHCSPFGPLEQAAVIQMQRHGECLRFPWFAEHRTFRIARDAGYSLNGVARCSGVYFVHDTPVSFRPGGRGPRVPERGNPYAGSRYGSNASIDTFSVGSASGPHSSWLENT